jgi:hypothetical protein
MDKYCKDCDSRGKNPLSKVDWYFCLDRRTQEVAAEYYNKMHNFVSWSGGTPSCQLVQAAYDGKCPYKTVQSIQPLMQ